MASGLACEHCSRPPYQAHHPDCPSHPQREADRALAARAAAAYAYATEHGDRARHADVQLDRADLEAAYLAGAEYAHAAALALWNTAQIIGVPTRGT